MQKLIDMGDAKARELMDGYYIVDKSRLENLVSCFESGAKRIAELTAIVAEQQKEINLLTKQIIVFAEDKNEI
jgi:hypothetical protein